MVVPDYRNFKHSNELYHYGMPRRSGRYPYGSGNRPYQNKESDFGSELYKRAEKRNLDKFGKDQKHNILYIDGLSGSGKSTLALFIKRNNDQVIHLDSYFERKNIQEARTNRNKEFNKYLEENNFDVKKLEDDHLFQKDIKEYFKNVDEFVKLSESFGEKQFDKNQRVIMEGVQVGDETLYLDKSFYNDKPYIHLTTDEKTSKERARERDLKHSQESEVKFKMNDVYYLSHGGPGSGRYPLGSGERPYQKFEGAGRKTSGISAYIKARRDRKSEIKQQKQKEEYERQRLKEMEEKRRHDADKQRILREGSASEVLKYKGELTNKEWQEAADRLRLEKQITGYSEQEVKSTLDKLKAVQSYTNVGSSLARDGIDLWNSFASVYNVTDNGKSSPLPLIGKGDGSKKK